MRTRRALVALSFLFLVGLLAQAALGQPTPADERPHYKSPLGLAIDPKGRFAYVALHTAGTLAVVDLKTDLVVAEIPVGRKPYDVALYKGTAYVTCEADDTLVAVDVKAQKVRRVFKVGQAPRGVAVDRETGLISVVCHDEKVLWTQLGDKGKPKKYPIPPQPDGNYARATNLEFTSASDPGYRPISRPYGLFTRERRPFDPLEPEPEPERTAFSPALDLDYQRTSMDLVAHTRPRWYHPARHAPQGRLFTNAFSFVTLQAETWSNAVILLDEPRKGYPDPTDVVVKLPQEAVERRLLQGCIGEIKPHNHWLNGTRVFITSGGADTVIVLDLEKAASFVADHWLYDGFVSGYGGLFATKQAPFDFNGGFGGLGDGPLPFLPAVAVAQMHLESRNLRPTASERPPGWRETGVSIREDLHASAHYTLGRLPTQANPRRMALTPNGKTLVVSNHLADSLTLIDTERLRVLRHIPLGLPEPDLARRGEILFHSAKHTFQQQFTCASCHPGGGSDGLAWDTSAKGTGKHLNTRALYGVRDTGPFGWKGDTDTLVARVKRTMRGVHHHQISDEDASAIAAYLQTLEPLRPLPQAKKDVAASARGKTLFFGKANCTRCHRGPTYSSATPRAIVMEWPSASGKEEVEDGLVRFDVPSLLGVGRTAPYLHDGRAATLEEIFQQHNPLERHGAAHQLTPAELSDLIAFLKTL